MAWYYIALISAGILLVLLLAFLIYKTLWGHMVSWSGGFIGFVQGVDYVARVYVIKLHNLKLKRHKIIDSPHQNRNPQVEDNNDPSKDNGQNVTPEQKEEIKRKKIEYAIALRKEQEMWEKDNLFHPLSALRINKSIPFNFDLGDSHNHLAIYYEQNYDENINKYIRNHYDELSHLFCSHSLNVTFVYFPVLLEKIQEAIQYNNPDALIGNVTTDKPESFYKIITENIVKIPTNHPMILITDYYNTAGYPKEDIGESLMSCYCIDLEYKNDVQFSNVLHEHSQRFIHDHAIYYCLTNPPKEDIADSYSIDRIAKEIQTRINTLYAMGVSEYVISQIVSLPKPKLSPLMITEDFRIILPEYNNMEIPMPTLSKTLYFFYLNHPEGVLFKELRDHKEELYEIYGMVSLREDVEKMKHSIEDIVDSTKNSVNEKCSRIRAAFISKFNDNLAHNYYITGNAGEPKKIILDRSLIIDNSKVLKLNSSINTNIQ